MHEQHGLPTAREQVTITQELGTLRANTFPDTHGIVPVQGSLVAITSDVRGVSMLFDPASAERSSLYIDSIPAEPFIQHLLDALDGNISEASGNRLRRDGLPATIQRTKPRDPNATMPTILFFEGDGSAENPYEYRPHTAQSNGKNELPVVMLAVVRQAGQTGEPQHIVINEVRMRLEPRLRDGRPETVTITAQNTYPIPRPFSEIAKDVEADALLPVFETLYYDNCIDHPDTTLSPAEWAARRNDAARNARLWFARLTAMLPSEAICAADTPDGNHARSNTVSVMSLIREITLNCMRLEEARAACVPLQAVRPLSQIFAQSSTVDAMLIASGLEIAEKHYAEAIEKLKAAADGLALYIQSASGSTPT